MAPAAAGDKKAASSRRRHGQRIGGNIWQSVISGINVA